MKKTSLLFAITLTVFSSAFAQEDKIPSYDFWVGQWNLTWDDGEGKTGRGTNNIIKILDGKVIQENFEALAGKFKGFKGMSMSVYSPQRKTWKQSWTDNQGGYFDFTGGEKDGNLTFETAKRDKDGTWSQQRMVFYNISENSLTWDWEATTDSGKTWKLQWRINYERAQ